MDAVEKINALLAQKQKKLESLTPKEREWAEQSRTIATDTSRLERYMQGNGICTPSYWIAHALLIMLLLAEATDCAEVPGDVPVFSSSEN